MARVFIIGGGSSLRGFPFNRLSKVDCITINRSLFDVPSPKYFITIDHSFLYKIKARREQKILAHTSATKFFIANFGGGQLRFKGGAIYCTKTKKSYNLSAFDVVIKSTKIGGIGGNWNEFSTGNCSGFCALQLAVLLGYTEIYLLGIDLVASDDGAVHYHSAEGYNANKTEQSLPEYHAYFHDALFQIDHRPEFRHIRVISCSKISALNDIIPYRNPLKVL